MSNTLAVQVDEIRNALVNPAAITAQAVAEIGAQLGMFYQAAEESGNQHAMTIIANTWDVVQHADNLRTTAISAVDLAAEIEQQRAAAVAQLSELETAIAEIDLSNEKVRDFWNEVEESVGEEMEQEIYSYASESIWDELYDDLSAGITALTGLSQNEHTYFVDAVMNQIELQPDEAEMLRAVIMQVNARISEEQRRAREEHNRHVAAIRAGQGR